jgi:hypothetical protein
MGMKEHTMMTRTNFKEIANIIRHQKVRFELNTWAEDSLYDITNELARYFKSNNPTFDRSKFMKAAGWYNE